MKKLTIENAHNLAYSRGFKFLSIEFKNTKNKHLWGCNNGHEWHASYNTIQQDKGCPFCSGLKKKTIEDAHDLAKSKRFRFLSNEFKNTLTKYQWECFNGHEWTTNYNNIQQDRGCPYCASTRKTISDAHKLADSRGFKFLSSEFINAKTKYLWGCVKEHKWTTNYKNIEQGSGCPDCASTRKTISDAHKLADSRGFKFLSTEFINTNTKYLWGCSYGHEWISKYNDVHQGSGCPHCPRKSTKNIEDAHNLAHSRGFKFLSSEFNGTGKKCLWECGQGHEWEAPYDSIQRGTGCPHCSGMFPKTIKDAHNLAHSKGFKFLSSEFKSVTKKHLWGCGQGHKWESTYQGIQRGTGCHYCSGWFEKTIKDAHNLAKIKGFKFLSTEFYGVDEKYLWKCGQGHEWFTSYSSINKGNGCHHCSGKFRKTIEDAHDLAESRGYKFLSTDFKNVLTKYSWQCGQGHEWNALYSNINQGGGCPFCMDKTRGEKIVRYCFEKIFKCDFKKIKPDWMRNPKTNRPLELDGYNENLSIAFEHQGIHHEEDCPKDNMFYKEDQLFKDEIKRQKCKERGIILIEVPEIGRRLKLKDVVSFLLSEFDKHNIAYSESAKSFQIDMKEFYAKYMNEKSTTGVDDLLSQIDGFDFSDDSLFVDSIMDEVNNLDFDDPDLFN